MKLVLQTIAMVLAVLATGAATVTLMAKEIPDLAIPDRDWADGTILDGRVFYTTDTILETGDIIYDEFHFTEAGFQSAMCQVYCDFGWSDYQTWVEDEVIHFHATTRCPDAPHTVVFHGTVSGDTLRFEGTWTTRRWYWTHQVNVIGEGTTTKPASHMVAS